MCLFKTAEERLLAWGGRRQAITLVEVMVVIVILSLLVALLLPGIQMARKAAARSGCQNNLRQIGLGLTTHAITHGSLPGGGSKSARFDHDHLVLQERQLGDTPYKLSRQTWGWQYQLLPYLDMENRWRNRSDDAVRASGVRIYLCPSRERQAVEFSPPIVSAGTTDYVGNACSKCQLIPEQVKGTASSRAAAAYDGAFPPTLRAQGKSNFSSFHSPRSLTSITDGLSSTVFVAEKCRLAGPTPCNNSTGWISGYPSHHGKLIVGNDVLFSGRDGPPRSDETDPTVQCTSRAGLPHGLTGNFLFGDSSVHAMSLDVDGEVWSALLSVDGKEDVDLIRGRIP